MSNTISCGCGKTIPAHGDTTCHCDGYQPAPKEDQ